MMGINLHDLVRGAVTSVHPDATVTVLRPAPFVVNEYGEQFPQYQPAVQVQAQSQPTPDKAVQFLRMQRENSIWRDFYFYGLVPGLSRADEWGGSLVYWAGYEWLVDQVLEDWADGADGVDWCKVRAVRQRKTDPPAAGSTTPPEEAAP